MRIAQLANFVGPSSGGMKTALTALGRGYTEAGHHRLLVVPGPRDRRDVSGDGEVVTLRSPKVGGGYRLIVEPWRVVDVLENFGPSSVEISDKSTLVPVARWARRAGVGTLLFSHERLGAMLALRTGWSNGLTAPVTALNRMLVRHFDRIVVTSDFAHAEFRAAAFAAGTPLHTVPLGVELDTFHPAPALPRADDVVRLVHVGRLSREKSPHLAVATAVALHHRGVRVRLDVYGTGPQRRELERLGRGAPVFFHGHLPDRSRLAAIVARADVALSVCPGETFGLAVLEALAAGTPVVTADTGGARDLVDESSGAWAPPEPALLADAVLDVAGRPREARRTAARRRAEAYPWHRTVEAMLALHARTGSSDMLSASS